MKINTKSIQIRDLFLESKLQQCIEQADHHQYEDQGDIQSYKFSQLYKALSYFELIDIQQGKECFSNLFEYSRKLGNVDEIDVISKILYLQQIFEENKFNALQFNIQLLETCHLYKSLNEQKQDYNSEVYNLGMSMYHFVQKEGYQSSMDCIQKQFAFCLEKLQDFKQEFLQLIGWMYLYYQMNFEAIKRYESLYQINPSYPRLANYMGECYFNLQSYETAQEYFFKAKEISPNNLVALTNIARINSIMDEQEQAIVFFKQAIEKNPNYGNTYEHYANHLYSYFNREESSIILEEGLKNDQNNTKILQSILRAEANNYSYDRSKEYLEKLIVIDPCDGSFEYHYATVLYRRQQYLQAKDYFLKSLKKYLHPFFEIQALISLSYIDYTLNEFEESFKSSFRVCNYDFPYQEIEDTYSNISQDLDELVQLSLTQKIEIINSQFGIIQARLNNIQPQNEILLQTLKHKSDQFVNTMKLIVYNSQIKSFLIYKNDFNYWDLYVD